MAHDSLFMKKIYFKNRENIKEYHIPHDFYKRRRPGLSAMIRLKNEEEWVEASLLSIKDWFDEIVIVLQNCTDKTESIIKKLSLPHVKIYYYVFDSFPNGPGYGSHPPDSVHNKTYFYNWTLAKTTCRWVCKWDGDMVAMDWLGPNIRKLISSPCHPDYIFIRGVNIVGKDLNQIGERMHTGQEPRFFQVHKKTFYYSGDKTQYFYIPQTRWPFLKKQSLVIEKPAYLHFKWAKSLESATKSWPKNWESISHFQKIMQSSVAVTTYKGEYPAIIRTKLSS